MHAEQTAFVTLEYLSASGLVALLHTGQQFLDVGNR
jgi:hypothetical protein